MHATNAPTTAEGHLANQRNIADRFDGCLWYHQAALPHEHIDGPRAPLTVLFVFHLSVMYLSLEQIAPDFTIEKLSCIFFEIGAR